MIYHQIVFYQVLTVEKLTILLDEISKKSSRQQLIVRIYLLKIFSSVIVVFISEYIKGRSYIKVFDICYFYDVKNKNKILSIQEKVYLHK